MARRRGAALVAAHLTSPDDALRSGRGYFDASLGSGALLVEALNRAALPRARLVLFGFSGGAHFVDSFSRLCPERVAAWCAYSAGWWSLPAAPRGSTPPGIIACGERDESRIQASLRHYQRLRRLGYPVLWVRLAGASHQLSGRMEAFARDFFEAALDDRAADAAFADISTRRLVPASAGPMDPALITQLPCKRLYSAWCALHSP
ncbi:MAG TPA: hypothetical protein PLU30_12200 [Verrucomicrobiae bacterium]|nr:hypothetical protein [Verrucomicrobiae bacterium]